MGNYTILPGYTGGKTAYIPQINSLFDGSCVKYIEPYVGGGGIFFSLPNGTYEEEWINDRNCKIANLYDVLARKETREQALKVLLSIEKNMDKEVAKQAFKEQKENAKPLCISMEKMRTKTLEERLEFAKATFWTYTQSFNQSNKGYSHSNIAPESYKQKVEKNLRNGMTRLYHNLEITSKDGIEIMKEQKSRSEIQIMADPPYVGLYRGSSNLYDVEMASLKEHIRLAEAMKDSKAAIVLCGYRSGIKGVPTIYDAVLGDDWKCFKIADTFKKCEKVEKGGVKQKAQEYVWTNRVPEMAKYYISMKDYKENLTLEEYWERIRQLCQEWVIPPEHFREYQQAYSATHNEKLLLSEGLMEQAKQKIKVKRKRK